MEGQHTIGLVQTNRANGWPEQLRSGKLKRDNVDKWREQHRPTRAHGHPSKHADNQTAHQHQ
jgi:hypothetical protein